MNIIGIASLKTNYIWIISNHTNECIIIDPGESTIILKILKKHQLILKAILLTHNHTDHTNGVETLVHYFPNIDVYGSEKIKNAKINIIIVSEGDKLTLLNKQFTVFNFPGHTKNHIGFYYNSCLFCGDTVFSAGCGKVSSGLMKNMYESLLKIQNFPKNTLIYCGHEYTLSNINFAISILPKNKIFINYRNRVIKLLKKGKPTIPTTLNTELQVNPFFLCSRSDIQRSLQFFPKIGEEWKVFCKLRRKKDSFLDTNYPITKQITL